MTGRDGLRRQLAAKRSALAEELDRELRDAAFAVAESARRRVMALRDATRPLPSDLAESIEVVPRDGGYAVRAGASHAVYVEFGTRRMPAQPFLGPAFDAERENVRARLRAAVAEAMETEA